MASSPGVTEQHEDWLNLVDPQPPWFTVPVIKRAFPSGLDRCAPEVRAGHKTRWDGADGQPGAHGLSDRTEYLDWLLREALGYGDDYLAGDLLPADMRAGVTSQAVTVSPTGVYAPADEAIVGFDELATANERRNRLLVFVIPAGTVPTSKPRGDSWSATWIHRAALACREFHCPLALVTDGDYLTLVFAGEDTSIGWGTWRADVFSRERVHLDSFITMLHARRFVSAADDQTPEALLAASIASQAEVTDQLGDQVRRAVELLVNAISRANLERDGELLDGIKPHRVYEASVTVMMRLVFLLVAEENELLPADHPEYATLYAIRRLREDLQAESYTYPEALESRATAWYRILATTRAVYAGVRHHDLTISAYGGNLFDPDRFPFLEGRHKDEPWRTAPGTPINVTDLDILAILNALLLLDGRRLSYRHVEVEQVGHIYERLLDHDTVPATTVILGCKGPAGNEPEIALRDIEAKALENRAALISFITDDKGKHGGHHVGTRKQVERLLDSPVDPHLRANLLLLCGKHELADRIEPYANLLRLDLRDRPTLFLPGALYVTETGNRRDTGTAYTTRELAEEVAEHALAALCYSPGPQDTNDRAQWQPRPSADILALKICDPAIGSGAILVAACRYLAEALVKAWDHEGDPRAANLATAADDPQRSDVRVEARRLVAEHCCYGVDRNPMAVEMAKMSMWIETVARDRPFTFLDHAIKPGDSLLGIWNLDQLHWLHLDPAEGRRRATQDIAKLPGIDPAQAWDKLRPVIDEAVALRAELHALSSRSTTDLDRKAELTLRSDRLLAALSSIADLVVGDAIATASKPDRANALTDKLAADAAPIAAILEALGTRDETDALNALNERARSRLGTGKPDDAPTRHPLHWPLAFPEVFTGDRDGFDAMVGNPPFSGGQKITGTAGTTYRDYLVTWIADGAKGSADLVAYFFLKAAKAAKGIGFLATNSIAQGGTSEVGLGQLLDAGWSIHRAVSSAKWPGDYTVEIAKLWLSHEPWTTRPVLDARSVAGIDEMLYAASRSGWRKRPLAVNLDQSFQGSTILGMGFTLAPDEAEALIGRDPRNAEVLFPYLGGEDLNQSPTQTAPRWVINFFEWPEDRARQYPECFRIVDEKVRPERERNRYSSHARVHWWQYERSRAEMYRKISSLDSVMAISRHSIAVVPVFVPTGQVLSEATVVFAYDDDFHFGVLSSGFHYRWAARYGSTLGGLTVRYTPSDVFETFPQPPFSEAVERAGRELNEHRSSLMVANDQGLTTTYNRVHDPDETSSGVVRLRDLHVELDAAVRDAYGWANLELRHGFHEVRGQGIRFTFAPEAADEVLERLLELNKERFEAEQAAGGQSKKAKRPKRTAVAGQTSLLDEGPVGESG